MAVSLWKIVELYNYIFYELQDVRTRDWFPNEIALITILALYYYFCKYLGPAIMKHRKPFELRNTIIIYNIFQILISLYLFVKGGQIISHNNLLCQPIDYSPNPLLIPYHKLVWIYVIVKLLDLLDTVFFVVRKKERQISKLHLFHHFWMPIWASAGLKYYPNGHSVSFGLINCFVHIIMYSYYLVASLGPKFQKYLWWKKYVTLLQLIQFVLIFIHNLIPLFNGCNYPKWINISVSLTSCLFIYMFEVSIIKITSKTRMRRRVRWSIKKN